MKREIRSWQLVRDEVFRRIHAREWRPGQTIPNESDLADEFGCARATVNRALRALADDGLLNRRRKAGTTVAMHPVRKATLDIPLIRLEIENRGHAYGYALLSHDRVKPPSDIRARMRLEPSAKALHVTALHLADNEAYVSEDRWINIAAIPAIAEADLDAQSANEWLVMHAPFTRGDIAFSATAATRLEADILGTDIGAALFAIERSTWNHETAITSVRLTFSPGYRMHTNL
ncbi:MAG: UTRA domain-containing protein [Geminicoccaceae bacterium]